MALPSNTMGVSAVSANEIDSGKAEVILRGFIKRIDDDPDIFSHHLPRRLTYDDTATLTYEGSIVRRGAAEGSVFHIAKPDNVMRESPRTWSSLDLVVSYRIR